MSRALMTASAGRTCGRGCITADDSSYAKARSPLTSGVDPAHVMMRDPAAIAALVCHYFQSYKPPTKRNLVQSSSSTSARNYVLASYPSHTNTANPADIRARCFASCSATQAPLLRPSKATDYRVSTPKFRSSLLAFLRQFVCYPAPPCVNFLS